MMLKLFITIKRYWKYVGLLFGVAIIARHTTLPDGKTGRLTVHEIHDRMGNFSQLNLTSFLWTSENVGFPDLNGSDCVAGFSGTAKNGDYIGKVRRMSMKKILEDAKNCNHFQQLYGMNRYPPPLQEEQEFPLAFSIVFHKDFDQVLFLLRAVYRPHNVYCLHVDKKAPPEIHSAVRAVVGCLPNVVLASRLEDVVYGGFSRLQADVTCMKDLLQLPVKWQYFINMVGQQFPLKSNLEFVRILKLFNGSNDVEGLLGHRRLIFRYKKRHEEVRNPAGHLELKRDGKTNPPPPHNLKVVKGSAFGTFSREFVQFMVDDPVAADLLQWSKHIYSPDEYVWATLHHSDVVTVPGGYTGKADEKPWFSTYANWGERRCGGKRVRVICIFSPEDLPLLSERYEFFANKFYITANPAALHCLDRFIYSISVTNTVRDLDFYRKLPFVKRG